MRVHLVPNEPRGAVRTPAPPCGRWCPPVGTPRYARPGDVRRWAPTHPPDRTPISSRGVRPRLAHGEPKGPQPVGRVDGLRAGYPVPSVESAKPTTGTRFSGVPHALGRTGFACAPPEAGPEEDPLSPNAHSTASGSVPEQSTDKNLDSFGGVVLDPDAALMGMRLCRGVSVVPPSADDGFRRVRVGCTQSKRRSRIKPQPVRAPGAPGSAPPHTPSH